MTEKSLAEAQTAADNLLTIPPTTENPSTDPRRQSYLHPSLPTIQSQTWKEYVAKLILSGLEAAIRNGVIVGKAMKDAIDKAITAATGFAKEHPVYFTLIALGVLVIQAPEILGWLGFAEVGIVEGTFTSCIYVFFVTWCEWLQSDADADVDMCVTDSFAALWQARYAGYVPKGSLFSYFQRLGMVWRR